MDWILCSNIVAAGIIPMAVISLFLFIVALISLITHAVEDDMEEWHEAAKKLTPPILLLYFLSFIAGGIIAFAEMPNILLKTNIAKIKLRYTNMETVQKLEVGAEEIVSKLDKLIDKGLESLEGE
jgi:hypothetical protein